MNVTDRFHDASVEMNKSVSRGIDAFAEGITRVGRGTMAGFFGGLIASWMMNQYQAIESRPVKVRREELRKQYAVASSSRPESAALPAAQQGEQATVKVAEHISRNLFDHPLTTTQKKVAGPAVHYGYGGLVGALYGGLSELIPSVAMGFGIPYATFLWLFGSETAVPALGLSKPPAEVSTEKHASNMATHFVYGVTLDISRRVLRRIL